MKASNRARFAAVLLAAAGLCAPAEARPLRWARSIDATTLDPHAANTGPNLLLLHQIYEPLILRRSDGKMVPALALSWTLTRDPTVWEFKLRPAAFHDGSAFDADDVVFSLDRARSDNSDMRSLLSSVERAWAPDAHTVRVKTARPDPLLPNNLTDVLVVDRTWTERLGAVRLAGPGGGGEGPIARDANGTGPYRLVSREPGERTVLRRNEAYWGRGEVPLDISEIVFRPIPDGRARVEALIGGEVDFVQDVPVGQIERLGLARDVRINTSPENRSVFLGLNVGAPALRSSDATRNPFADRRVREAVGLAIDREALRRGVMRDQSVPAGVILPPFSNGYTEALDRVQTPDPGHARALLSEAGFPDGFSVTLHCTNDRYLSDAELCRAVAEMLTDVGIRATPRTWPAAQHFPAVRRAELDLYLLGWGVSTFDSEYVFSLLYHTNAGDLGGWNGTGFSDPGVDAAIRSLRGEIGASRRNLVISQLWERLKAEAIYVPLHNQTVTYAMRRAFDIPADVSNQPKMKFVGPPPS